MSVNYFNAGEESSGMSNDIMEEIEYRVVSNKISKLTNPVGNKIVESTVSGDVKESDASVQEVIERVNAVNDKCDENYRKLNTKKVQKFSADTPQGNIVITRDNGGLSYTEINAETLNSRVEANKTSVENLETRVDTNKSSVEALETRVTASEVSVGALELKDFSSYISVSAELSGPIAGGEIFSYGSGAPGNLRGGYVVIKLRRIECINIGTRQSDYMYKRYSFETKNGNRKCA